MVKEFESFYPASSGNHYLCPIYFRPSHLSRKPWDCLLKFVKLASSKWCLNWGTVILWSLVTWYCQLGRQKSRIVTMKKTCISSLICHRYTAYRAFSLSMAPGHTSAIPPVNFQSLESQVAKWSKNPLNYLLVPVHVFRCTKRDFSEVLAKVFFHRNGKAHQINAWSYKGQYLLLT